MKVKKWTPIPQHTDEQYAAFQAKMLAPFFEKHSIQVSGGNFGAAFVDLREQKPELFEHGGCKHEG